MLWNATLSLCHLLSLISNHDQTNLSFLSTSVVHAPSPSFRIRAYQGRWELHHSHSHSDIANGQVLCGFVKYKHFCDTPQFLTRPTAVIEVFSSVAVAKYKHGNQWLSPEKPWNQHWLVRLSTLIGYLQRLYCGPVVVFDAVR